MDARLRGTTLLMERGGVRIPWGGVWTSLHVLGGGVWNSKYSEGEGDEKPTVGGRVMDFHLKGGGVWSSTWKGEGCELPIYRGRGMNFQLNECILFVAIFSYEYIEFAGKTTITHNDWITRPDTRTSKKKRRRRKKLFGNPVIRHYSNRYSLSSHPALSNIMIKNNVTT